jgi:TetR/AcrR family transcriptional regulator, transcriptional repressor for nem operon
MGDRTTREQIVEAADRLFYRQGYARTSFSDIAGVVRISRGNFYFHFKSKDEILDAVVERRLAETGRMLQRFEADGEGPQHRIRSFIDILVVNRSDISRYGCPVGTLCTELAKLGHASQAAANELFTMFRAWLRRQFTLLGCGGDADALAMHLLARSQGIAAMASALRDETFIRREVDQLYVWLETCTRGRKPRARSGARAETGRR